MLRRLVPLALVVTALLAVVALAARGRPLSSGAGTSSGLPAAFWDYVFTTLLILAVIAALIAAVAFALFRRELAEQQRSPFRALRTIAMLLLVAAVLALIGRHIDLNHLIHPHQPQASPAPTQTTVVPSTQKPKALHTPRPPHFRWEELAIVLGLLVLLGGAVAATRSRLGPARAPLEASPELLAAALDESLDDLLAEPDLRRAIVAAYARMERTLAVAGLPRRPAEAPLEYLERTLLALDASAAAVRRLTDLFEWARFSHHEPEPWMRDEAVDALVAVRDELRASEPLAT